MHLPVPLHGRTVEVPRAALEAELARTGSIMSLALVEAVTRWAPREEASRRLVASLDDAYEGPIALTSLLAIVRLDVTEAAARLLTSRMSPPIAAAARAAHHLLARTTAKLAEELAHDDLLAQRVPLVLCAVPTTPPHADVLFAALLTSLDRLQPTLGISAYRALLGDLAEAVFRALQRGDSIDALLGDDREALVDRVAAELPGTPDLVAARGMAWLLGTLAATDDAARSAIERARARFRDPAFHDDCDAMLDGKRWPP